jgi:thioredoxin-related protein
MKHLISTLIFVLMVSLGFSQASEDPYDGKIYNPEADAAKELEIAINKAARQGKHVLVQVGGNWCGWCIAFNKKVYHNDTLRTALKENFVTYHLNYSRENWNEELLAKLDYPQRFGFPVFVVLDGQGRRLHTQNSAYLEGGKGHDTDKVLRFFNHWSPKAVDPKSYPPRTR